MDSVEVIILGQRYKIKGDTDANYIKSLADYLNARIEEIASKSSPMHQQRVIILSALSIIDELFKLKTENETLRNALSKAGRLLDEICRV